jgi:biotin carboxyl carrier protein
MPGKLIEVCVDEGDVLRVGDVVCVVQQMKMEIEIRAKRAGRVVWVMEVEDGEEVSEGILAAEIEVGGENDVVEAKL